MRKVLMAAAAVATLAGSVGVADAMPLIAPAGIAAAPDVTLVSGGCGPFRHRTPWGWCRPNGGPVYGYGYGPRPGPFYGPYGWHRWHHPYGWRHYY